MNLSRRFQLLKPLWYCRDKDCPSEGFGTAGQVEISARAHVEQYGHEVRVRLTREVIFRPAEEPAEAAS